MTFTSGRIHCSVNANQEIHFAEPAGWGAEMAFPGYGGLMHQSVLGVCGALGRAEARPYNFLVYSRAQKH